MKLLSRLVIVLSVLFFTKIMVSCDGSMSDEGDTTVTFISINSEGGSEKLLGQTFTFKVKNNLDQDVTAASVITVNGQAISGNTFTPSEKGSYTVSAQYENFPINPITVQAVVNEGTNFRHRILYEEFTGTWCGYCTVGLARHDYLSQQTSDFVFMGIHGPQGSSDPWATSLSTEMEQFKNVVDWPTMFINRTTVWVNDNTYQDMSVPLGQLNASSKIGIKINSTLSGNNLNATADVFFAADYSNVKLAAFIVEDELLHNQKNYNSFLYGGAITLYDFKHHNVLRNKLTPVSGDAIPATKSAFSEEYSQSFQFSIPAGYNLNHVKIVVMVLDGANNGKVLNVREEYVGNTNDYEFL